MSDALTHALACYREWLRAQNDTQWLGGYYPLKAAKEKLNDEDLARFEEYAEIIRRELTEAAETPEASE